MEAATVDADDNERVGDEGIWCFVRPDIFEAGLGHACPVHEGYPYLPTIYRLQRSPRPRLVPGLSGGSFAEIKVSQSLAPSLHSRVTCHLIALVHPTAMFQVASSSRSALGASVRCFSTSAVAARSKGPPAMKAKVTNANEDPWREFRMDDISTAGWAVMDELKEMKDLVQKVYQHRPLLECMSCLSRFADIADHGLQLNARNSSHPEPLFVSLPPSTWMRWTLTPLPLIERLWCL